MSSLIGKRIGGQTYYYLREVARVGGRPKIVSQRYLGKADDIAAAMDVPVVTVFGPTHPEWTEIYYAKERQVAVKVFCGPCQKKTCPLDHRCMTRVTPGMVYDTSVQLLDKLPVASAVALA